MIEYGEAYLAENEKAFAKLIAFMGEDAAAVAVALAGIETGTAETENTGSVPKG